MKGRQVRSYLFVILALFLLVPAAAQELPPGAFAGVVRDEQGKPLTGAVVTFTNLETDQVKETRTGPDGRFSQGDFSPGRYLIAVQRDGQVIWSFPVQLPRNQQAIQLEIDLRKVRELAELRRLRTEVRQQLGRHQQIQRQMNRGVRSLDEGQSQQAEAAFKAALDLDPTSGVAHGMLAAAYAASNRLQAAMDSYRRALELEPEEAAYSNNLGTLLVRAGKLEEGLARFREAAESDPARAATYEFNIGAALLNAGRAEEAVPVLQQVVRADPTLAVGHYFLGLALFKSSPRSVAGGVERVDPREGTVEEFRLYLQLAPEGRYGDQAREHLRRLDALTPDLLLPVVDAAELFD